MIGVPVEKSPVTEFAQLADKTYEALTVYTFDSVATSGVSDLRGHKTEGEEEAVTILMLFIFAGDQGNDFLKACLVKLSGGDVHGITIGGSADYFN